MSKLDVLRKLIREELRQVLKEELRLFLQETKEPNSNFKSTIKESIKQKAPRPSRPQHADPLQDLLAETAYSMNTEEYKTMINAGSDMAQGFPQMMQYNSYAGEDQPRVVESVTDMLATARPSNDINQVQIDTVPDFSQLMQTMKAKGQI